MKAEFEKAKLIENDRTRIYHPDDKTNLILDAE